MNQADRLNGALLQAHRVNDIEALACLYTDAADAEEHKGDVDAACFYLTQAWVHALQAGLDEDSALRARLRAHGRLHKQ